MTNLPDKAKSWKSGGLGAASDKPLARSPDAIPLVRAPLTEDRKSRFLEAYRATGSVQKAAEMVDGTDNTRRTYLAAMARDPAFGRACEDVFESWKEKVADVLKEEFFEGQLVPVVNKNGVVTDPETKKPIWIRKRDPKIILAYAKKFDFGLREIKTTVHIDAGNPNASNPDDPRIFVQASDLWKLPAHEAATLVSLLRRVHENRQETMTDITPRPSYLEDLEIDDAQYTEENPYDI